MELYVYTDGGSRGNPGVAGIGVYITKPDGTPVEKRFKPLGHKTNNEAEYSGVYYGIARSIELGAKKIQLYTDSTLVVKQLQHEWKTKKETLKVLQQQIEMLVTTNGTAITYHWIPREKNKEADRLSNVAMDTN